MLYFPQEYRLHTFSKQFLRHLSTPTGGLPVEAQDRHNLRAIDKQCIVYQ
jgi:hypothetical protein